MFCTTYGTVIEQSEPCLLLLAIATFTLDSGAGTKQLVAKISNTDIHSISFGRSEVGFCAALPARIHDLWGIDARDGPKAV